MTTIAVLKIVEDTMVDGPGFRTAIYCAGCEHHCPACHNPQSWDINAGTPTTIDELMKIILADNFADVTFTGGDPLLQAEAFTELAQRIKTQSNKTIWCYTGYTFEQLQHNKQAMQLLQWIDVLVDGAYIEALRDSDLLFRGSTNQRLIDIPATLATGNITLWKR